MADEDNVLQEIAQEGIEELEKMAIQEIGIVSEGDVENFIQGAKNFIHNVDEIYTKKIEPYNLLQNLLYKKQEEIKKATKNKTNPNAEKIIKLTKEIDKLKNLVVTELEFKFFISQFEQYQHLVHSFLGFDVRTAFLYVDPESQEIEIYEVIGDVADATYQTLGSKGTGLSARFNTRLDLNDNSVFRKMERAQSNVLDNTYKEVIRRAEISKKHIKKKSVLVILWKPDSVWRKMVVAGGYGDLAEGYMGFAFNEEKRNLLGSIMEKNVGTFMTEGVGEVDQIAGWLKGDINASDLGTNVQIASKTAGASLGGYKEAIRIARLAASENPKTFVQKIKQQYEKMINDEKQGKGRRNKEQKLYKNMSQTYRNMISEIEDGLKSNR